MCIIEPLLLVGEGEYNLNALTEIKATDSYVELGRAVTNCQTEDPFYNCTTKKYIVNTLAKCGCLPLTIPNKKERKVNHWLSLCIRDQTIWQILKFISGTKPCVWFTHHRMPNMPLILVCDVGYLPKLIYFKDKSPYSAKFILICLSGHCEQYPSTYLPHLPNCIEWSLM